MSPYLEEVRSQAERLTRDLSPQDWRCADDGKWSASLILEHLLLTFTATTKGAQKTMQLGKPLCRDSTLRDRVGRFYVLRLGKVPKGLKAAKNITPRDGLRGDNLRTFNDALVAMDASLADAERRFGRKTRILDHPLLGPLTAEEWRRFHHVHAEHHFRQLVALRQWGAASQRRGLLTEHNSGEIPTPRRVTEEDCQQRASTEKNTERDLARP